MEFYTKTGPSAVSATRLYKDWTMKKTECGVMDCVLQYEYEVCESLPRCCEECTGHCNRQTVRIL